MTAMGFTADDIAELRRQGDLITFIRDMAAMRATPVPAVAEPTAAPTRTERPGAWPAGCERPLPGRAISPEAVQAAVDEYRHWDASGRPAGNYRCDCGCMPGRHFQEER